MKRDTLGVLFFLKKNQLLKNGEAPISLRITVNSIREEMRIQKSIAPTLWDQAKERSRGRDRQSRELNDYIDKARIKLSKIFSELELGNQIITADIVRRRFFGLDDDQSKTLLKYFKEHNDKCRTLIGIDYVDITVRRYECCERYLGELIRGKYGQDDMLLRELTGEFIRSFEFYLKTEKGCAQNTVIRYMKCFKKVINLAVADKLLTHTPFAGIKFHEVAVIKDILSMEELSAMYAKKFAHPRLERVRDVFIFQCFTGLAFIDVLNLRAEHLTTDNNKKTWIRKTREKTNNMCNIPLLSMPLEILGKYTDDPVCERKNTLLPVMCNQNMNAYLKEIAVVCGINKKLTTHTARHTFATVIALANDVSLSNVAKMLGHSSTRMTQHYAKAMDSSIMRDMQNVDKILSGKEVCSEK